MGKEWEHTSWEQQHFIRMLLGISNVGYTDKVTDTDFYQTRCSRHFIKMIWIQGPMLRRSTGRRALLQVVCLRISTFKSQCSTSWVGAPLSLHRHHASQAVIQTPAPTLAINHFHNDLNRCNPYNQWARCKPREGLVDLCTILERRLFLKYDADIVCRLCANVGLATRFCAVGAHLWWHYTESKHARAVVCGSGHFPHHHHRLHKDHCTTLLFTVRPADELLSVVRLWSVSTAKQKGHLCYKYNIMWLTKLILQCTLSYTWCINVHSCC